MARVGEHADGHDFVAGAVDRGAAAALVARPVEGVACVVVDDVEDALAALAREVLRRLPGLTVIGITGSSGKTSTKDLLGPVLATDAPTVAPVGSYNRGRSAADRLPGHDRHPLPGRRDRGARHRPHRHLARMAPPESGSVLNVGTAHVGEFGSHEATATAKCELVVALPPDGLAVLNADDAAVRGWPRTAARVVLRGGRGRRGARHRRRARRRRPPLLHPAHPARQPSGAARTGRRPPRRQRPGRAGRRHRARNDRQSVAWRWSPRSPSAVAG